MLKLFPKLMYRQSNKPKVRHIQKQMYTIHTLLLSQMHIQNSQLPDNMNEIKIY